MRLQLRSILVLGLIFSCAEAPLQLQEIDNPATGISSLPRLYTDNTGTQFMSWVEQDGDLSTLYYSKFENGVWSSKEVIASSNTWFVNWADFPSLIAVDGAPMAAHWLNKIPGNRYSYNVEVSTVSEGNFSSPLVPHDDGTATEHGFVSMVPASDSTFYVVWLDGRNMSPGHGHHGDLSTAMTIRGALINSSGEILEESEIDNSTCECCNTALTKTDTGVVVAYRNRTETETRDIYTARYSNGAWQSPVVVHDDNWEIAACPVNGPSLSSVKETVALAWFTGVNDNRMVKLAFSENNGETFNEPITVFPDNTLGRVDVEMADSQSAWVSVLTRSGEAAKLDIFRVSITGETLDSHTIEGINPARGTGFPQITSLENGLLVAWTDFSDESKSVKTAILQ